VEARVEGVVVARAEAHEVISIEGHSYVPRSSLAAGVELQPSDRPYHCPWKGPASYWHLVVGGRTIEDAAWSYAEPDASAVQRVGADFTDRIAFDRAKVQVSIPSGAPPQTQADAPTGPHPQAGPSHWRVS
jgi:uncharacterized protein (DUF427 family)